MKRNSYLLKLEDRGRHCHYQNLEAKMKGTVELGLVSEGGVLDKAPGKYTKK